MPEGETLDSYFARICRKGLEKRLATSDRASASEWAAEEDDPGVSGAAGARDRLHPKDEVSRLFHDCMGLYPICA